LPHWPVSECELHRWRKAFRRHAAREKWGQRKHAPGVACLVTNRWMTLAYLKGSEAADEHVQEKVNKGVLAAFA